MSAGRRICVVTGTRAEYGLLMPLMRAIKDDPAFTLQVVATGAHLAPEFGFTVREIEADGFNVDARVEMLLSSDSAVGAVKSMGLGAIGLADAYERLKPDLIVILGDRYEALAAAASALLMRIPVAHISGGDVTAGAFDDALRHAITKMSHLHFTASEEAAQRVRQLGEEPGRVFAVGDPGLDYLRVFTPLDRDALAKTLGIQFRPRNLLITFHPATLGREPATKQFEQLLAALDGLGATTGLLFTKPNADPAGRALIDRLDSFVAERPHASCFTSLGQLNYLSLMKQVDAVVGNSSSGLLEAPSFSKPTVNVGDRQSGRLRAASVIDCPAEAGAIRAAIDRALSLKLTVVENPYGDGHAAARIVAALKQVEDFSALVFKKFCDLPKVPR